MSHLRTLEALLVIASLSPILTTQFRLEVAEQASQVFIAYNKGEEVEYQTRCANLREKAARLLAQPEN